jgi:hypothetical protein
MEFTSVRIRNVTCKRVLQRCGTSNSRCGGYTPLADGRRSQTATAVHEPRSPYEIPSVSEQRSPFSFASPLNGSFRTASHRRWKTAQSFSMAVAVQKQPLYFFFGTRLKWTLLLVFAPLWKLHSNCFFHRRFTANKLPLPNVLKLPPLDNVKKSIFLTLPLRMSAAIFETTKMSGFQSTLPTSWK